MKDKSGGGGGGQKMMSHMADPKNLGICPIELAVALDLGGWVSLEVKLLIGALGGPHKLRGTPKGPPRSQKWLKMTMKVKKLKNHNRIKKQGPFF